MNRRDFLKALGLLPIALRQTRFEEAPQIEGPPPPPAAPSETMPREGEELSFETPFSFSHSGTYSEGYPYKVKWSKRLKYAWDELKWRVREWLYGRDYWDDY